MPVFKKRTMRLQHIDTRGRCTNENGVSAILLFPITTTQGNSSKMPVTAVAVGAVVSGGLLALGLLRLLVQWGWGTCKCPMDCMAGRTVLVTGANSGLGKITARELAKHKARVILACRDVSKGEEAAAEILRAVPGAQLSVKLLDLGNLASVRSFAADVLRSEAALHVLVNNAGVLDGSAGPTADGFERQFGVNHLGHFLLTLLLLDRLRASAPSRVVIVSSSLYRFGNVRHFLDGEGRGGASGSGGDGQEAYRNSKLANVLFARQLSKLSSSAAAVDVLVLSPGMAWTNLGRNVRLNLWKKMALALVAVVLLRTPLQASQTILHCAMAPEVKGQNGAYFRNCKKSAFHPVALDDPTAEKLWDISEKMVGLK